MTLIWQLRRYLYGPLTEGDVRRFRVGGVPPMSFEGVMAFFPLVNDDESLRQLDVWIATQILLALRKRARLLRGSGMATPHPHGLPLDQLLTFRSKSRRTGDVVDVRMPSVRKMASLLKLAISTHGLGVVAGQAPLYLYLDDTNRCHPTVALEDLGRAGAADVRRADAGPRRLEVTSDVVERDHRE